MLGGRVEVTPALAAPLQTREIVGDDRLAIEARTDPAAFAMLYERGVALHERCASLLAEAELKVQQLVTRAGGALETIDVAPDSARDTE